MSTLAPIADPLLGWYHACRRILPFREDPTPYHVWVSEVMLQQTRVNAALPYYERFMQQLPDVAALAACDEERLHKLWEGLGYYSRARNLQKAARVVVEQHKGQLPDSYEALLALPGIGEYTAGAIASIALGLPHVAVDGNVLRVFSRLLAHTGDVTLPEVKKTLAREALRQMPPQTPGDYNQALMELGALVCLPGVPKCEQCPLAEQCAGLAAGIADTLPCKAPKKQKVQVPVCVFVVHSGEQVLIQQRPQSGLLAGLWQPPVCEGEYTRAEAQKMLQQLIPGTVLAEPLAVASHVFTHRVWQMYGWRAKMPANVPAPAGCIWATPAEVREKYTFPGAFRAYMPLLLGAK